MDLGEDVSKHEPWDEVVWCQCQYGQAVLEALHWLSITSDQPQVVKTFAEKNKDLWSVIKNHEDLSDVTSEGRWRLCCRGCSWVNSADPILKCLGWLIPKKNSLLVDAFNKISMLKCRKTSVQLFIYWFLLQKALIMWFLNNKRDYFYITTEHSLVCSLMTVN